MVNGLRSIGRPPPDHYHKLMWKVVFRETLVSQEMLTHQLLRSQNETAIRIYQPQNVFQKHGPRPAPGEGVPAILRESIITQDKLLPNMCRAPEIFYAGRA